MSAFGRYDDDTFQEALKVARMYYHLGLTTNEIALQLGIGRPSVSRLLGWAKSHGLVEFRVLDHRQRQLELEGSLERTYALRDVKVVPVHPDAPDTAAQRAVARFTAHHLNSLMSPGTALALAWGATVSLIAMELIPKPLPDVDVIQMNGSGNSGLGITYAGEIVAAFAQNYGARSHLLPIPAYFDESAAKEAMSRERSVRRVRELAAAADIALYSVGVPDADSYVYRAGYVEEHELRELKEAGAVADIATVFFRTDGSYRDIAMNSRSSGPELTDLKRHKHAICVVAGLKKVPGVLGALHGGFLNTLIIDEPSARALQAAAA